MAGGPIGRVGGRVVVSGCGREGRRRRSLAVAEDLADLDTAAGEDAGKDACLESLALDAGEASQQRGRRHEVSAEPETVLAALLNYVQLVANLEGQVGGRRGLEWIGAYCECDARERPPARHGAEGWAIWACGGTRASRDAVDGGGEEARRDRGGGVVGVVVVVAGVGWVDALVPLMDVGGRRRKGGDTGRWERQRSTGPRRGGSIGGV